MIRGDAPIEITEAPAPDGVGDAIVMKKVKVLFVSANPISTERLQIDDEIRQIGIKLRAAEHRDALGFIPRFAARPDDLLQGLLEHKPQIVHFSGHGSRARTLTFVSDRGKRKPVSEGALVHLFQTLKDDIRLVVLNACSSRPQAEAIARTIDCTIGMRESISDDAAIVFAASFYRALGFGRSVKEAFELGKAALLLEGIPEEKTPELLTRSGVDASSLILVRPKVAAPATKPEAPKPGKPAGMVSRLALMRGLGSLSPADWQTIVSAVKGQAQISRHGTVAEQAAELIRWAESPTGPGMAKIEAAYEAIRNP
jgi:hypothetical protein